MTSQRWIVLSLLAAALGACASNDDDDGACSPVDVVDDVDDARALASSAQALSVSDRHAVVELIDGVLGLPRLAAGARSWSEAPRSSQHLLARDFVERVLIDDDGASTDVALRTPTPARYTGLRRVAVAGDLVLVRSDGEREGSPRELYDLFRVSNGRIVERWNADRPVDIAASKHPF